MLSRSPRILSKRQRDEILQTAHAVRRRRRALGLTQVALDHECGFKLRIVDKVERRVVDRRSPLPDDPRVVTVVETLERLELNPQPIEPKKKSASLMKRRPDPLTEPRTEAVTLKATVKLCPDHGVWITQGGCDGLIPQHPVCRSLRNGKGCRGVKHRRTLVKKSIEVDYTPPRPGDWTPPRRYRTEE